MKMKNNQLATGIRRALLAGAVAVSPFAAPAFAQDTGAAVKLELTAAGRALKKRAASVPVNIAQSSGCQLDELSALTARLHALREQLTDSTLRAA